MNLFEDKWDIIYTEIKVYGQRIRYEFTCSAYNGEVTCQTPINALDIDKPE